MTRPPVARDPLGCGSMPLSRGFLAALLAAITLASPSARSVTLLTEENPPFNYTESGKLTGMATEIVLETARRAKLPMKIDVLPWNVAFQRAQAERETCLFATARLENRERLFTWIGPLANNYWGVYGRPDFAIPIRRLEDMKPLRIGGVVGDAKVEYLKENAVTNIKAVHDDKMNPPRLLLPANDPKRIDLWITGIYAARGVAKAAGVQDVKLVFVAREIPLYLACSPQTSAETLQALGDAFGEVKAEGLRERVNAAYEKKFER
jgi:polar amino acid transport system substrate-binding protein